MKEDNSQFCKLDDIGTVARGKSKHRPRNDPILYGGKYPFIQTGDVKHANFYITNYSQTYNEQGLAQSKLWQPGTLCITIAANIADNAILKIPACFPDSIIGFVPHKEKSDVRFIKYCLDTYKLQIQSISRGTTQDNLSLDKLCSIDFKIPPFPIQKKIAAVLSAYDDLIENNNRRIAILEKMAEEIYREWFVRMRFPGHEQVKFNKGVPVRWEGAQLRSFGKVVTGKTPSTLVQEYYNGPYPFIKTPDMHGNMFILKTEITLSQRGLEFQQQQTIPEDSICVNCIGALSGSVSITVKPCQTNQQINSIVLKNSQYREYLFWSIKGLREKIHLFGNTGSTMTNLSKGKFGKLQVLKPLDELIKKYHYIAKPIFNSIKTLNLKNMFIKQSRDLLLPRLISGKLSVEDLDIQFPPSMEEEDA